MLGRKLQYPDVLQVTIRYGHICTKMRFLTSGTASGFCIKNYPQVAADLRGHAVALIALPAATDYVAE
jgi:hypothetical protein